MNKIRLMILEDDMELAQDLKESLEELGYVICGVAHTLIDAVGLFYTSNPDIAIVDLMIEDNPDGIAFAKKINEHPNQKKPVIFLTGMRDKTSFDLAKKTTPSSYLLKPFNILELQYAIELAIQNFEKSLVNTSADTSPAYLFIKKGNHLQKLSYEDISFIKVEGKHCDVITKSGKFVVQYSLKELLKKLPSSFLQTHRNYIVNTGHIIKFNIKENYLLMPNEKIVSVGKSYKERIFELINKF